MAHPDEPHHNGGNDQHPQDEGHQATYCHAARFVSDDEAYAVYAQARDLIFAAPVDLSVVRFLLDSAPHVVIIGASPGPDVDAQLQALLSSGQPVVVPPRHLPDPARSSVRGSAPGNQS